MDNTVILNNGTCKQIQTAIPVNIIKMNEKKKQSYSFHKQKYVHSGII